MSAPIRMYAIDFNLVFNFGQRLRVPNILKQKIQKKPSTAYLELGNKQLNKQELDQKQGHVVLNFCHIGLLPVLFNDQLEAREEAGVHLSIQIFLVVHQGSHQV